MTLSKDILNAPRETLGWLSEPFRIWAQTAQVEECSKKSMNFGVRQARLFSDLTPPRPHWSSDLDDSWPPESQLLFCTWAPSAVCLVPFLAPEGCPVMWSSYHYTKFNKGPFPAALMTIVLPLILAEGGLPWPPLHVNCADHWRPGFSPTSSWKLPPGTLLQNPISLLQTPGTLPSVIYMLVIPELTWAMTSIVLDLFFYLDFLFQFLEVYVLLSRLDCKFLEGREWPYNLLDL